MKKKLSKKLGIHLPKIYLDRSPAFLTSDDFIRSNEIIRSKWPIYFVLTI